MKLAAFFLLAAAASAQPLLTLEAAVTRALETHPDLAAARASRAVADFQIQAARSIPPLELRLVANNFSLDPEAGQLRNSVGWKWSPPRPRELTLRANVARAGRLQADADVQAAELRVANAVRLAYRRAAIAEDRARLAMQTRELRQSLLDTVRRQVAAGLKEAVEADLAELALADADALRTRADSTAAAEKRRLSQFVGETSFTLATPPLAAPQTSALLDRALRARPDLSRAVASCQQADAAVQLASNQRYPWLNGVQLTRRIGTNDGRLGPWGVQIGVDLPIFRSGARAETRVASAVAERCRLEEAALRVRVRREVEESAAQWSAAQAELDKLDQLSAGPAARALARLRAALDQGKADRAEVLQAEARLLALRDRWLERRFDLASLESQLELAAALLY